MLKHILVLLTLIFCFSLFTPSSQAHLGGVPFINIDDKPTLINNFNNYSGREDIPQDNAPDIYLTNEPIKFEVIQKFLQIPQDVFDKTQFRWKFDSAKTTYETGNLLSYSFSEPKTYFAQLEVKGPDQSDFQPLNTLNINIVKDKSYKLPKIVLEAATDKNNPKKPIKYIAKVETDPTAQIAGFSWDFDDNQTSSEQNPVHEFNDENIIHGVTVKVTDSNGYIGYAGVQVFNSENKLEITNIQPGEGAVNVDTNFNNSDSVNPLIFAIPILLIVAGGVFFFTRKNNK